MINSLNSKQLGILLPNTNKALGEALKSASPKQLETISSFKDLKSMMSSILKQSTNSSSSDKVLLELVKNNPTLKNLGSVSNTIKDLLNSLKSDKNPLPIENKLKNILLEIKDLRGSQLKQKLINSDTKIKPEKEATIDMPITISCGVASFRITKDTKSSFLKNVDIALYTAKNNGKNQVITYE